MFEDSPLLRAPQKRSRDTAGSRDDDVAEGCSKLMDALLTFCQQQIPHPVRELTCRSGVATAACLCSGASPRGSSPACPVIYRAEKSQESEVLIFQDGNHIVMLDSSAAEGSPAPANASAPAGEAEQGCQTPPTLKKSGLESQTRVAAR